MANANEISKALVLFLGSDWSLKPSQYDNLNYSEVVHKSGASLSVSTQRTGKGRIWCNWPHRVYYSSTASKSDFSNNQINDDIEGFVNEINFNPEKPLTKIYADVVNKLLSKRYLELYAKCKEYTLTEFQKYDNLKAQCAWFRREGKLESNRPHYKSDRELDLTFRKWYDDSSVRLSGEMNYDLSVDLELDNLPQSLAEQIVQLVNNYKQPTT